MGRKIQNLILNKADKPELLTMSRSGSLDYRYVIRSKIILMCSENKSFDQIQEHLKVSRATIATWKKRFLGEGIKGLMDKKGRGKLPKYTAYDEARVVEKACNDPGKGYTNWSQKRIAQELGMSQSTVCRILKRQDLKPHKTEYWCGKSTDPEFESKMLDVVGLYLDPPDNAIVLSVDEKTQIQALDRTQPLLPLTFGKPKRLTTTYKRNGTVCLIAALAVHQGEIIARTMDSNNADNFLKFLKNLYRKYPHKHLHIIADNLSVHKQKDVTEWIKKRRRLTLHFTPTYGSWLNQIEIWFNILSKDVLKGGIWHSKKQLTDQIMQYIDTYNKERAHPFKWAYNGKNK